MYKTFNVYIVKNIYIVKNVNKINVYSLIT